MSLAPLASFTDANFDAEVLASPLPVLVDFGAVWCTSCRALAPVVRALASAHPGRLRIGELDVDHSPDVPTRYGVRSVPTLLLFRGGRVVGQLVGAVARAKLEAFLAPHFGG